MKMGDFLTSINMKKKNLIRESNPMSVAEKMYPSFPIARSLSYHPDIILFVNEINQRGLGAHKLRPVMHFEYLLYSIPRRNRFAKWQKPAKGERIELIKKYYKYSTEKAMEVADLLDDEPYEAIRNELDEGGKL